ncbi:hypothetical protein MUK42_37450 [Musa troglodytarum]|uniref:Uncharacterized protein n=1 Tax=Musa troglodytarum TaxID=320322 RepID=A0A9E7KA47_9LILI|nr:hypothetical protein MUK42_37450 [Musa troglodytarum]
MASCWTGDFEHRMSISLCWHQYTNYWNGFTHHIHDVPWMKGIYSFLRGLLLGAVAMLDSALWYSSQRS